MCKYIKIHSKQKTNLSTASSPYLPYLQLTKNVSEQLVIQALEKNSRWTQISRLRQNTRKPHWVTREDGDLGTLGPKHCQALTGIVAKENFKMDLKDNK